MNKHLHNSLRALFLSLAVFLSLPMLAVEVEIDGIKYDLNAEAKQAAVIKKSSGAYYSGSIVIPESVVYEGNAYSVASIGVEAFWNRSGLTSITIPNSVTSIGKSAFYGCSGLTSVSIGNSVTSIGEEAFRGCSGLISVTIPNSVTSIGDAAFYYCKGMNSVTIGNSVTSIGSSAFSGCSGLKSVTIPNSVKSIGSYAFKGCDRLTSVHISDIAAWCNIDFSNYDSNPLYCAHHLYLNGEEVKDLVIPNSVTSIGRATFSGCSGLKSVTIPNSVTSIGEYVFYECSGLTSVHISDIAAWCNIDFAHYYSNPLYYAHHLYLNGEEVKDLVIPNSMTSIGYATFSGCRGLTSVTIPNSVTSIEDGAFNGCSGLTSVTIPNSVKNIEGYAFRGCSGLKSVTIPNSVTSIGGEAFMECSGLTSVTIPNSMTSIGYRAFSICTGLTSVTIPNSVTSIGGQAFFRCSGLTSVTIPNSVESIESQAFYRCSGLTSVTIGNSVKSIGEEAFRDCSELLDVYCYAENVPSTQSNAFSSSPIANATLHVPNASVDSYNATEPWNGFGKIVAISTEVDGINYDFNADTKEATVIAKSSGMYSGKVIIPESVEYGGATYSVTSIGYQAFRECSGLTSVTIGNSVESIGDNAFYLCSGLTSVTIGNSVTSIGDMAFYACSGLTSVTIPNSVTSIGDWAFSYCSGLTSVAIPNSVTSIGDGAFSCCSGLTSIVVEDRNSVYDSRNNCNAIIETATNTLHSGCKKTIIPNNVTSIGDRAFIDCSGLTSVTIPNSVTSIGDSAFEGCSGLTSVTIGNSVTSIGDGAFMYCSGFTSVTIPNSVTSIGDRAFYYCSGLTSVTIPNSVTSIGDEAFSYCSGLTSVAIPNSVTSIEYRTFAYCSGLTSVTIPNSVTSIGDEAFSYCSGLTSVTIGNSVESIGSYAFYGCPELLDVYCYAENVPSTESNAFSSSPITDATLHVPNASINSYKATEPWSRFGRITPLPNLTLTDGEEFENNTEQTFSTLTYTRTLPNMLWNPLYVPFKIPYEDLEENYEVAYINAMHSYDNDDNGEIDDMVMEIVKVKAGTLKPNHPYLIKAKNEEAKEMSIVQENATLYPAEITTLDCSSMYTKFEITGTYQKMTSGELNGSLVISTDGAWKKLSSTSTLKPFRFYLTISSREGSPVEIAEEAMSRVRIRVMGEDDNATGIDEVKTANDEQKSEIYDLSGRRASAPAKGGVYIIKGKKVIY